MSVRGHYVLKLVILGAAVLLLTLLYKMYFQNINLSSLIKATRAAPVRAGDTWSEKEQEVTKTTKTQSTKEEKLSKDEHSQANDEPDMVFMRTYGQVKKLPTAQEIENMSEKAVAYTLHSYLDNIDFLCKRKIRLGVVTDGGYETCDDYEYRPIQPCIVYSFGILNMWSFDDDVAKLYKCHVYCFDPSIKRKDHQRSERVWFYDTGIGGSHHETSEGIMRASVQHGWVIKTLTEIKQMLHHQNKIIDLLKIDVEDSEWPALEHMLASGELKQVRQLLIEFHVFDPKAFRHNLGLLQQLEALGFRRFRTRSHPGPKTFQIHDASLYPVHRGCCYEMGFVNEGLARKVPV